MKKLYLGIFCLVSLSCLAQTDTIIHGKIPIDPSRWYQLNNVSNGLQQLFDGDLYTRPNTGWGKVLNNYDSYYPFPDSMNVEIDSIKLFDWEGNMAEYPATFYAITDTSWQRIHLATFIAGRYNIWNGPNPNNPDSFALDTPVQHIRYLVLNAWYEYPTEVEFYGSYRPVAPPAAATKTYPPLKNFFGVNGFEWNYENPVNPMVIDSNLMHAAKSFTGLRHYMDWQKPESNEGEFTFDPVHSGGWNYDTLYSACKAQGITVLACLKTVPGWMLASYPANMQNSENVPVRYGKDFTDPASYTEQATVAFQYAARYGSNTNVNPALVSVDPSQRWTNDQINTVKIGLGLVKYIECDNERDKWWFGRQAYQTGREYAANLSAFYDGNMGELGPAVGVKTADTSMKVVASGLASANTDYVRGMVDWCKEFRGYKADGSVNLCWDVINYHLYANDARYQPNDWPTTGVAPELSTNDSVSNAFVQMAHQYVGDMPVWITETGYDVNQGSPDKAIPIGNRTALETQADWILRTALQYAKSGLQRTFFYEMYDDNPWNGGPYETSGLLNWDMSRRPAADFLYQTNKLFGSYKYQQTLSSDPVVDQYGFHKHTMYALWVPDETGRTATYNLNLGSADTALVYQLQEGSDSMSLQKIATVNGYVTINVTETPLFVTTQVSPDSLFTFCGQAGDSTSNLQWQVSADTTVQSYAVESSINGTDFTVIGSIPSGKNSSPVNNYQFTDAKPAIGVNYYRLRKTDVQSNTVYSNTIALTFGQPLKLNAYPNPATENITIEGLPGNTASQLTLVNEEGKVIGMQLVMGRVYTWDVSKLAAGVYFLTVEAAGKKAKFRFVKAK
jgi:hypothetical protein